jgi:hypothetical protein
MQRAAHLLAAKRHPSQRIISGTVDDQVFLTKDDEGDASIIESVFN